MRDSMICPKCQSTNIFISKERPKRKGVGYYDFRAFSFYGSRHSKITDYTCGDCGYTEMWVTKEQLQEINEFLEGEGIIL